MAGVDEALKAANEVLVVLSTSNLTSQFKDVHAVYEKEDKIRRKNLKEAKEIIQSLHEGYAAAEDAADLNLGPESYSQEVFQENMDKKKTEDLKIRKELKNLEREEKSIEALLCDSAQKIQQLCGKKKLVEKERSQFKQEGKLFYDLYLQTTGIHWDYNCSEDDIRGFVSGKKDIKPISLKKNEHSSFHNANYLWDLIDATHKK